jgi:hypothetical protein
VNADGADSLHFMTEVKKLIRQKDVLSKKSKLNTAESDNGNIALDIPTSKALYEAVSGTALPEILCGCQAWTPTVTAMSA